jgi:hypothetical protein
MAAPYQHLDMTPEYNRIITALTGIRDDVRLLRTLQEDPESGIVVSHILNDFQRAMLAVSLSTAVGNTASAVSSAVDSGTLPNGATVAAATGDSNADLSAERASILTTLGQDPKALKVLLRIEGQYYWEADPVVGPDDGLRGPVTQVVPFALGQQLGFDNEVDGVLTPGVPAGAPTQIANPSKPRKRWPFARPAGATASQLANPTADLVDPATGQVVAKSTSAQSAANASGDVSAPATEYPPLP